MNGKQAIDRAITEIHNSLRFLSASGYRGFDCSQESLEKIKKWGQDPKFFSESLDDIRAELGDCQRCRLARGRKKIVFGDGKPGAKLVFVGEGPGFEEDQQGKPFVGAAGQLLTRIIEAIKLTRDQVYICNIIKCRPPGNRNPEPDEIRTCFPFLERQIAAIQPDFICALGTFAAQTLLQTTTSISRLRGRFHEYKGIKVLPTYHPAYLLRNPDKKRDVWEDMKMLIKEYHYEE
ncbi:MAG: uracil-DNA glycosylase [Desulfobacterales bacterium]|nr:MAG: uracil-DNA glycosylase [Desulfobacterales bacterium]